MFSSLLLLLFFSSRLIQAVIRVSEHRNFNVCSGLKQGLFARSRPSQMESSAAAVDAPGQNASNAGSESTAGTVQYSTYVCILRVCLYTCSLEAGSFYVLDSTRQI